MYSRLRLTLSVLFLALFSFSQAQSVKLTGKVLNEKNEPLAGVSVKIVGSGGTTTDMEGRFSLNLIPGKKYELEFSAIGYETKNITEAEVSSSQLNELNITLQVKAKTGENVVVTTKTSTARKETINAAVAFQKNTNTVAQIISAETIRRSPDKTTSEILKRVPGTSVQDGKYLIVRGLSDRYNQAMLNGILLSSTEPDRKTFSFDIFPAAVIDNITINKAFVPEYPGEWAGGLVQVNTKDIPSKDFFNVQIGTGFNTNVIGNDFLKYKGSNLDFLGFDNKTRALPSGFPLKSAFDQLSDNEKLAWGATFQNNWGVTKNNASPNASLQIGGGFAGKLFNKKVGGSVALNYNRSMK
ncbi:MAG TPA: carboxypeptidase-like regulatory domain-containing protein, partial [Chitinophagaceae bacterium]